MTEGLFSSKSNEWATPIKLFKELDAEFHFTLDPCSTRENAKCERHFTIEEDGLKQDWGGSECSAVRRMAENFRSGCRSVTKKAGKAHWSSCLSRQEQIQVTSTSLSTTRRRYDSCAGGCISTSPSKALLSLQ